MWNYGRNLRLHRHEVFDGHAFKGSPREECVQMPAKMTRSVPRPPFGLPDVPAAIHTSRGSCGKARKAQGFMPLRESSRESRL
jgi:hypothetical protein